MSKQPSGIDLLATDTVDTAYLVTRLAEETHLVHTDAYCDSRHSLALDHALYDVVNGLRVALPSYAGGGWFRLRVIAEPLKPTQFGEKLQAKIDSQRETIEEMDKEIRRLYGRLHRLMNKVEHGCTDAACPECD